MRYPCGQARGTPACASDDRPPQP